MLVLLDIRYLATLRAQSIELQRKLVYRLVLRDGDRIAPGVAGAAVRAALAANGAEQSFETEISHGIGVEKRRNLVERVRRPDEFGPLRRVHAVEAGRNRRRTADADMHLFGPCRSHHLDDLPTRRAAHDRIVDENDALPARILLTGSVSPLRRSAGLTTAAG